MTADELSEFDESLNSLPCLNWWVNLDCECADDRVVENEIEEICRAVPTYAYFLADSPRKIARLLGEVKRMRELIKESEYWGFEGSCPWCDVDHPLSHRDSCPAFTPEGKVK